MRRISTTEQTARKERIAAIRRCRACDPCGWQLNVDGGPIDPAVRCTHDAASPPTPVRDITEPIHQPDLSEGTES